MDIKSNAKEHFKGLREGEMGQVLVPEWGTPDEPAIIYFRRAMKLKEQEVISKDLDANGVMSALALNLVTRGLNENGERIWRNIEKIDIMNKYEGKVVSRIVEAMNEDNDDDLEAATKN